MAEQPKPDWWYDDLRQVGLDFDDPGAVAVYDRNQGDRTAENEALAARLGLGPGRLVVEFGCGTGSFARAAARAGAGVRAVDVSAAMLAFAEERTRREGLAVAFHRAGFLSYRHDGGPADAVVSQFALHHLPDFWKGQALARIAALLRPGGLFYLRDVVFGFAPAAAREGVEAWIGAVAEPEGAGFTRADFAGHVRDEHSTYDFLLEALLQRCGFEIEERWQSLGAYAAYLCRRR
ncbi:Methyltransferase domain-containing protein [Tistlia consotensis]|uniref:Methyltransferase domain-containing protein n=1 Tax=Tistlia consotensis USBA 355 TaxID=560819 RepID=A0A1Y6CCJ3_9PROT|nr:class I SAM-dependent methyltransferase [Tistlia consotensis]SMF48338.1 Methyltransferase domain-containing protein [Tistlia consotensis USBA 355]SNR81404.1 Methyltransferase domain-containing protein [Tistlia consotensis]